MIIVILRFNGKTRLGECDTLDEAKKMSSEWIKREKKGYPNAHFQTVFYEARKIE